MKVLTLLVVLACAVACKCTPGFHRVNLASWGYNHFAQLGIGRTSIVEGVSQVIVPDPSWFASSGAVPSFTDISCGEIHCIGLSASQSLYVWGSNRDGQLGAQAMV